MLNKSATRAATGSADFTCKLWDALSGAELHSWSHNHIVRGVHFSMVSDKLATACHDKCIRIFDTAQPDKECVKFAGMRDAPRAAKLVDRDSCILLSYLSSSGLDVLDTRSGKIARSVPTSAPVTSMNISYDGQQVTTASASTVSVYDTKGMKLLGSLDAEQQVESASLDLSKGLLAVGGQDMWAYVLEWPTGKPVQVQNRCSFMSACSILPHVPMIKIAAIMHMCLCHWSGCRLAPHEMSWRRCRVPLCLTLGQTAL